jgi:hypothetical protein
MEAYTPIIRFSVLSSLVCYTHRSLYLPIINFQFIKLQSNFFIHNVGLLRCKESRKVQTVRMQNARLLGSKDSVILLPPNQDILIGRGTNNIPASDKRCSRQSVKVRFENTSNTVQITQVRSALFLLILV